MASSFLGKLKGAVWEDSPKSKTPTPQATPIPTAAPVVVQPGTVPTTTFVTGITTAQVVVDPQIKAQITAELDKATPEILASFFTMLKSFAELQMDEALRLKSAYVAFRASRGGAEQSVALLQAMDKRETALPKVRSMFDSEMETVQKEINQLQARLAELNTAMSTKLAFDAAYMEVSAELARQKQSLQSLRG